MLSALQRQLLVAAVDAGDDGKEGRQPSLGRCGGKSRRSSSAGGNWSNRRSGRWTSRTLARILERLHETVLLTRRRPELAVAATHRMLMDIARDAARGTQKSAHSAELYSRLTMTLPSLRLIL